MIEEVILNHLKSQLTDPVHMEKPDPAPERYVLFERTGGGKTNKLPSATFAFQSYAESLHQAALLNESVKAAVDSLITLNDIASVRLNTDYNFTDTITKKHRYQAVFDIKHY